MPLHGTATRDHCRQLARCGLLFVGAACQCGSSRCAWECRPPACLYITWLRASSVQRIAACRACCTGELPGPQRRGMLVLPRRPPGRRAAHTTFLCSVCVLWAWFCRVGSREADAAVLTACIVWWRPVLLELPRACNSGSDPGRECLLAQWAAGMPGPACQDGHPHTLPPTRPLAPCCRAAVQAACAALHACLLASTRASALAGSSQPCKS